MTGRLPIRFGLAASKSGGQGVFSCTAKTGLPEDEVTLADLLKGHGYRTHMVGCAPSGFALCVLISSTDGCRLCEQQVASRRDEGFPSACEGLRLVLGHPILRGHGLRVQ